MRKLLVPIDFSGNSINALKQAFVVAERLEAKLYVVHAYRALKRADTMINVNKLLKEEAERKLEKLVESLQNSTGISIKTKTTKGKTVKAVEKYARKIGADLIIVGAQGETNDPTVFLGPIAGGLIKKTEIPVLIIPNKYILTKVDRILFTLKSLEVKQDDQLMPLVKLSDKFGAKIQLLQIQTPDIQPGDLVVGHRIKALNAPIDSIEATTIYDGLKSYLEENHFDLICVMRRRRKFLELLLTPDQTRKTTFDSDLPMLVLRGHW